MSFNNPDKESYGSSKLYTRNYKWSGGLEKPVDPNNEAAGIVPYAAITWREGSGEDVQKGEVQPGMKIAVIGVTFSANKYVGADTPGNWANYQTNETTEWNQTLHLTKWTSQGGIHEASGSFNELKAKVPGLKAQYHVYFYDFELERIDRITFSGSSYGVWKDYNTSVKEKKYTAPTIIEQGEYKKWNVGKAFLPKFSLDTPYTPEQRAILEKVAVAMDEYEEQLAKIALEGYGNDGKDYDSAGDQTPAVYDGEASQELPDASTAPAPAPAPNTTDLGDIPF